MCDGGKEGRLQWQDGVGNIQVCDDAPLQETPQQARPVHQLSEVDAGWALAVAGLGLFIVFALCIMAKCKLSLFTRKAKKKKIQRGASEKKKKVTDGAASAVEIEEIEEGKQAVVSKRQKGIIDMIDAALGEEAVEELGEGEQFLHCSLDSLDRIGDVQRRASQGSLALSLVFDNESSRPVFKSQLVNK